MPPPPTQRGDIAERIDKVAMLHKIYNAKGNLPKSLTTDADDNNKRPRLG